MGMVMDRDFNAGIKRVFHYDHSNDSFAIETRQSVTDVVEQAKARAAEIDERAPWKGDFHHVAQIPIILWEELRRKGIADDPKALKAWLNDRDNLAFRTRPGRV